MAEAVLSLASKGVLASEAKTLLAWAALAEASKNRRRDAVATPSPDLVRAQMLLLEVASESPVAVVRCEALTDAARIGTNRRLAIEWLDKALSIGPYFPPALTLMVVLRILENDLAAAGMFAEALKSVPGSVCFSAGAVGRILSSMVQLAQGTANDPDAKRAAEESGLFREQVREHFFSELFEYTRAPDLVAWANMETGRDDIRGLTTVLSTGKLPVRWQPALSRRKAKLRSK